MSYTGFFAEEDLYEVAKDGDSSKGSWVVPVDPRRPSRPKDFVTVEDDADRREARGPAPEGDLRLPPRRPRAPAVGVLLHARGAHPLHRVAGARGAPRPGRSPDDAPRRSSSSRSASPRSGSGAFAIEAVRQLADEYLKRRQDELGERIDPDEYPTELQKVKAHIALHQVYGVDLNATAVELAEVSLWLDTMVAGLQAPWFGLRLRRGNSLIGARRAVYSQAQLKDKSWLTSTPQDVPLTELAENLAEGRAFGATSSRVHHFLLPGPGLGVSHRGAQGRRVACPRGGCRRSRRGAGR